MTPISTSRLRAGPPAVEPGTDRTLEWLVDNAATYHVLIESIRRARESIWISQLAFDVDCRVYGVAGDDGDGVLLIDELIEAAVSRGIAVRIIVNESMLLDTAASLRKYLDGRNAGDIRVRGISSFPELIHAKMLIADGEEAILIGSPFVNGYWDDGNHAPHDARRPDRELGGRPLHDLSFRMRGDAVSSLATIFAELWNDVSIGAETDGRVAHRRRSGAGDGATRIIRTAPASLLPRHPDGLTEILDVIEHALWSARQFVYIEHQYLSSVRVIAALAAALERQPHLQMVIVLNQNPDVTAYRVWQNTRLQAAGLLDHPRVGLFTRWSAAPLSGAGTKWEINQVFVHSKVLMVDHHFVTAGSANLDGVSLHSYGDDFESWIGQRVFRRVRNVDVNVVIDGTDADSRDAVRSLREQLWREHLATSWLDVRHASVERWLPVWRDRAAECVQMLNAPPCDGERFQAIILPYTTKSTPGAQLRSVGVLTGNDMIQRFNPSWLEVHCSPNWIRNMFA